MKKKILFIVNPISGLGKQKKIEKLIAETLDKNIFDHTIEHTKAPQHATTISKQAASNHYDIVVAVGGDGSVHEVAAGLIGTTTAMAIIPAGSGNGFARHLKIPMYLNKAMDVINKCQITKVDTVQINEKSFVNVSGLGLDAHIGWEFSKYGKRGFWSYVKLFLREYPRYKSAEYQLNMDGKEITRQALLISFANGSQYGNNAFIAPKASVTDGLLEVCILKIVPFYVLPFLAFRLFTGTIEQSAYVETFRVKKINVQQKATYAHLDGEPVELGNAIQINMNPLSLSVITPSF